jgi:hypothetical protein
MRTHNFLFQHCHISGKRVISLIPVARLRCCFNFSPALANLTWNVVLRESIASFSNSFKNFHLKFISYLKVLSSEKDLVEIRLIERPY